MIFQIDTEKYKIKIPLLTMSQGKTLQKWARYNQRLVFNINNFFKGKEGYIHSIDRMNPKTVFPNVDLFELEMTVVIWERL